jgi:hypothetical protein
MAFFGIKHNKYESCIDILNIAFISTGCSLVKYCCACSRDVIQIQIPPPPAASDCQDAHTSQVHAQQSVLKYPQVELKE